MLTSRFAQLLIFLAAIALRFFWGWTHTDEFVADFDGYIAHSESVVSGSGFLGPFSHQPTAFRPPGYPVAIGLLTRFGLSPGASVATINAISGLVILGLIVVLLRQLELSAWAVTLGLFLTSFDPLLLRYSTLPMTEVPCAALLLSAMTSFAFATKSRSTSDQGRTGLFAMAALSGAFFGIGALTRPIMLVACGLLTFGTVSLMILKKLPRFRASEKLRSNEINECPRHEATLFLVASTVLISCLLSMSPWILRNAVQFGRFIPATTHGGYTLALGNNSDFYQDVIRGTDQFPWDGDSLDAWQQRMISQAIIDGVPAGDEPLNDAWYYQQAVSTICSEPVSFLKASLLRVTRFWAVSTAADGVSPVLRSATSIWYLLVWIGLGLSVSQLLRRKFSPRQMRLLVSIWLVVFAFSAMHTIYWTDTRMRAPIMPLLCALSALGWTSTVSTFRSMTGATTPDMR